MKRSHLTDLAHRMQEPKTQDPRHTAAVDSNLKDDPHIVVRTTQSCNGKHSHLIMCNPPNVIHHSKADAVEEAGRLARSCIGSTFTVFQAICSVKADLPVVVVESHPKRRSTRSNRS